MLTDLNVIATMLEGLEETIIARLIDRAQYCSNRAVYLPGQSGFRSDDRGVDEVSLLDLRIRYQEVMDSQFGRFHVPEERPFSKNLPPSRRTVNLPDSPLRIADYDRVNLTSEIAESYRRLVGAICPPGDDGQYGSSVELDVAALQIISRRIHFGALYVAESKYRTNPGQFDLPIQHHDELALGQLLTRPEVEERIIDRVGDKVAALQTTANPTVRNTLDGSVVEAFYRETIIPLTKRGEILYLLYRNRSDLDSDQV